MNFFLAARLLQADLIAITLTPRMTRVFTPSRVHMKTMIEVPRMSLVTFSHTKTGFVKAT